MKTKRTTAAGEAEMVEVQGTHILRPTGGRDRHSKIYTAKGPRDRRVRLSAHTAIQFYDVQDRLGYDRPSKAVDWLITKAKSSIDKLSEPQPSSLGEDLKSNSTGYCFQLHGRSNEGNNRNNAILPLDLDSMKAFFPTSSAETFINFQTYPSNLISQTVDSSKDLDLSLQTFKNVGMVLAEQSSESEGNLFSDSSPAGFEAFCRRMVDWNSDRGAEHGGGFVIPTPSMPEPPSLGQGSPAFPPRETLQPTALLDIPTPDYSTRTEIQADDEKGTVSERLSSSSSPISRNLQRIEFIEGAVHFGR